MQQLEALGRRARHVGQWFAGETSRQIAAFEKAKERMKQVGGIDLLITLGERLKSEEFETPLLFEQHPSVDPNQNRLIVLWGRQRSVIGSMGTEETYRGVSIVASSNGKVHVEYTKSSGWTQLEKQPWFMIKAFQRGRKGEESLSLEEKVQEAIDSARQANWEALDMRINNQGHEEFGEFESIGITS